MNKNERKNLSEIITLSQGDINAEFLKLLGVEDIIDVPPPTENECDTFVLIRPTLYQVGLGMGYLELPQGNLFLHKIYISLKVVLQAFYFCFQKEVNR